MGLLIFLRLVHILFSFVFFFQNIAIPRSANSMQLKIKRCSIQAFPKYKLLLKEKCTFSPWTRLKKRYTAADGNPEKTLKTIWTAYIFSVKIKWLGTFQKTSYVYMQGAYFGRIGGKFVAHIDISIYLYIHTYFIQRNMWKKMQLLAYTYDEVLKRSWPGEKGLPKYSYVWWFSQHLRSRSSHPTKKFSTSLTVSRC